MTMDYEDGQTVGMKVLVSTYLVTYRWDQGWCAAHFRFDSKLRETVAKFLFAFRDYRYVSRFRFLCILDELLQEKGNFPFLATPWSQLSNNWWSATYLKATMCGECKSYTELRPNKCSLA